ncbi:hypothetical protein U9M48_006970 [Paspalum notatum var. saurae]|uniref:SWIM-type domain-containing protein n=1 Tax=Paspalum notatum var. saurae TaxID=547442 RepID=A0AAQ3PVN9_PASNO
MASNPSPTPRLGMGRLRSIDSPKKALDLSWVPDGMDHNTACRLAIRVPGYEQLVENDRTEYHITSDKTWVRDKHTISWMDLYADLDVEIKRGRNQRFSVSFWDKVAGEYKDINSDSTLLAALDMYWDIRRLPLLVSVTKSSSAFSCSVAATKADLSQPVATTEESPVDDPWGENNEIEYVGVDDEKVVHAILFPDDENISDYIPDTDEEDNDNCAVDDDKDCVAVEHVTDLENPKIEVGVTFEDGHTFKRAIRQYAILNEIEIAAPYSEAKRYRGFCKAKKCKWRIHASQLQDRRTWMIKKIPNKHYCKSTSKLESNCMANQFWVRDRVAQWLREDPTIGASALKNKLEEKYLIQLSYWVVYNGRQLALNEILGKWEDSFDYAYAFKTEIERKSPGSIVAIDYEKVGSKIRFSKGIDIAVTKVFTNGTEHKECIRHLYKNFKKRYHGKIFEKNLWPAARTYRKDLFDKHYDIMKKASPKAIKWIEDNHKHLWARCFFSAASKCDYVNNNIVEAFNNWVKHDKSLPVIELMDKIRQKIMEKLFQRRNLALKLNSKVRPHIVKDLTAKSRGLVGYSIHKNIGHTTEISGVYKDLTPWRHAVNLEARTCTCNKWQMTGLPCTYAISLIYSYRGLELEDYVDSCYSVSKFKAAYEGWVEPIPDKTQWPKVDMGFKLWPPVLKRAAGRPRTRRMKRVEEGGSKKRRQCKRCGQFGYIQKTCNETVYDSDAPSPAPPKPKRKRTKKKEEVVIEEVEANSRLHSDDAVRQFLEQCPLPMLLRQMSIPSSIALQSETDVPGMVETVTQCLHKVFSSRYGASLLPNYGAFIQAGLLTDSKDIRKLACKATSNRAPFSAPPVDVDSLPPLPPALCFRAPFLGMQPPLEVPVRRSVGEMVAAAHGRRKWWLAQRAMAARSHGREPWLVESGVQSGGDKDDTAAAAAEVASRWLQTGMRRAVGVLHLLDKAEDDAAAVETVVQHNLYPLLINCLIAGDEEISAVILYAVKRLAQIPKGAEIIFPPGGLGSMQLGKVAALSSSLAWIRILSLIAKLFTVSSYTATSIRDSNLLSIFEDEIKDRRDMLKTLSALEVLYELVEHPHSNIFLLKTNLLQLIIDVINDSSADSVIRSRAALISGRLLSSADAFTAVDQSYVTNLLVALDKILKMEESMNTDEIESALETLGLIGTTTQGAHFLLTSSNVVRHVVKSSFDYQGRGRQLAALHAFGSICGADRQEDQVKLDGQAEDCLKLLVYTTAANSPKFTPSALLLSILQQDPDIRIAGYRVISVLVVREWCLREVFLYSEIIKLITDPTMETTKIGLEARYDCCVAINKALSSSHLLHEASLPELVGKPKLSFPPNTYDEFGSLRVHQNQAACMLPYCASQARRERGARASQRMQAGLSRLG